MTEIQLQYRTKASHITQILTGFHYLAQNGAYSISVDGQKIPGAPALVQASYRGKRILYDVNDGYFDLTRMRELLRECDFYFQRSFCPEKNREYFGELSAKMFPLGLNYQVTYPGSPLNPARGAKQRIKKLLGLKTDDFFVPEVFEGIPQETAGKQRILFYTRLWPREAALPEAVNQERDRINAMRIEILRRLREKYKDRFDGGVENSPLARQLCPDLILPRRKTRRYPYLKRVRRSQICIGSMGLHGSIGWKTAEYVAAAKAIVIEQFPCTLPGEFTEGKNFLSYQSAEECLLAVDTLMNDKALCDQMQKNNFRYYNEFLKPDRLIRNTLQIVDAALQ